MASAFFLVLFQVFPLGDFYLAVPSNHTVVLPATVHPLVIGGSLPPPLPPSREYMLAALTGAGRTPGDVILAHRLIEEEIGAPRQYPGVGLARVWRLTYCCEIVGPDGPYVVYTDRTALIRVE
jgi:hypothetical protein